ncbi:MAG: TIGR03960 family B12-binding radical SAM protein [Candidatus Firestonebacteria bacterium]
MANFFREQITEILPLVNKPVRYIGGEINSVLKSHSLVDVKIALAFPDVYEIGMSYLGFKIIYEIINSRQDCLAERVYAPWIDMELLLKEKNLPLFTLESYTPLSEFDIIGFSVQYEMNYTNILQILELGKIPIFAKDRNDSDPIVIAGGPCTSNPEPLADFIDVFVIGEGEEIINEIIDVYKENKNKTRKEILLALSKLSGIYVPSFYEVKYNSDGTISSITPKEENVPLKIEKRIIKDLNTASYPVSQVVSLTEVIHDRLTIEIMRGCKRACRFCCAGSIYRPVRERNIEEIEKIAIEGIKNTGYNEISLSSLCTTDHSQIKEIIERLNTLFAPKYISISLPSLRVDSFSVEIASLLQKVRKVGLTFAPEAGTQRMRDVINKNTTEEDLMKTIHTVYSSGWDLIKLYFMIGLPTEQEEDVREISSTVKKAIKIGRSLNVKHPKINVSISSFIPKSHTVFQWEAQDKGETLRNKISILRRLLQGDIKWHDVNVSLLEAVFARGDRRLGKVLFAAYKLGCRFDSWAEHFKFLNWEKAFEECKIDPAFYANRKREYEEILPWDHISYGVSKEGLKKEIEKVYGKTTS